MRFINDLGQGLRFLRSHWTFSLVALVTVSLGIGATTAIFSVVKAVLLEPLPYEEPDRLVVLHGAVAGRESPRSPTSLGDYFDYREQSRAFAEIAAFAPWQFTFAGDGRPLMVTGGEVSAELFEVLAAQVQLGRTFTVREDRPGGEPTVVLGDGLWRRFFAGDPDAVGSTVRIDGIERLVIGVMEPGFSFPDGSELWVPLGLDRDTFPRQLHFLHVLGRLAPDITINQARADMRMVAHQLEQQYPESNAGRSVELVPLDEEMVGGVRPALLVLLAASVLVLLIACCNFANLLLARSAARRTEMAVRTALGAGYADLVRQLYAEAALLVSAGTVVGVVIAHYGVRALVALNPGDLPRNGNVAIDGGVLLFAVGLALATTAVFGLVPALRLSPHRLSVRLRKGGSRGTTGVARLLQRTLVVAEVALAVALVIAAGLLVRSFAGLVRVDPGFRTDDVLAVQLQLPPARYPTRVETQAFYSQLIERVQALPGVEATGATWTLPFDWLKGNISFLIEGRPAPRPAEKPRASLQPVTAGFFSTLEIPLLAGRAFTTADHSDAEQVVIVNRKLAETFFPRGDALGKQLHVGADFGPIGGISEGPRTIVGVVGDIKRNGLAAVAAPELYVPHGQCTWRLMNLVVRSAADPEALGPLVSEQVWALDGDQPISSTRPLAAVVAGARAQAQFLMILLVLFATLALVLAAVGIYGLISYTTARRRHEIGLRMALGARQSEVVGMVVRQGMALALLGLGFGLLASAIVAAALDHLLSNLLFGVTSYDPLTFTGVVMVLAVVALAASYLPARRAARVDPMAVMREV